MVIELNETVKDGNQFIFCLIQFLRFDGNWTNDPEKKTKGMIMSLIAAIVESKVLRLNVIWILVALHEYL